MGVFKIKNMTETNTLVENSSTKIADESTKKRFVIAKDGNGNDVKFLNFDNPDLCPREGIITLKPFKTFGVHEQRHKSNVSFTVVRDRQDDFLIGIPKRINNKTKEWEYETIRLKGEETLDLSIKSHRQRWACIRLSPFLEGSPNLQALNGKPLYKVVDNTKIAENFLSGYANKRKAEEMAFGMAGEQLTNMARVLGISVEMNTKDTLRVEVIKAAQKDPDGFLKIALSPVFKHSVVFKKGVLFGIIEQDHLNGYTYRGVPMGQMATTESGSIQWLAEHPDTSNAIDVQCMQRENAVVKEINESGNSTIQDEKDVKLAEMMAQNKALLEKLEKLSSDKLKEVPESDDEMVELKRRAGELKIKSFHLYKDKEELRKVIKEKEDELLKS